MCKIVKLGRRVGWWFLLSPHISRFFEPIFTIFCWTNSIGCSMKWNKMRFHPSTFAMPMLRPRIITIIIFTLLLPLTSATTTATEPCRFSFLDGDHLYNYTLSSPIRNFPHGILSEDGCTLSLPDLALTLSVSVFLLRWFNAVPTFLLFYICRFPG